MSMYCVSTFSFSSRGLGCEDVALKPMCYSVLVVDPKAIPKEVLTLERRKNNVVAKPAFGV